MNRAEKRRQQKLAKKAAGRSPRHQSPASQERLDLALQHHAAGRLAEAGQLYQQIIEADPRHPVALQYLGVLAHQTGKNEIAVDLISQALAIKPDYAEAHGNLGVTLNAMGRQSDAVASYRSAIALKPGYVEAHYNLGIVLHQLGELDAAIASYRCAVELKPDHAEAHGNLGNVFKQTGALDAAVACYQRVIALRPDKAEAHSNLGVAFNTLGRWDAAAASLRQAIAINPGYAEAHNNLGNVLANQGRLSDAAASYRAAIAISPELAEAHNNLGTALKDMGRLDEALVHCNRALAIDPDAAEAHSNMLLTALYEPAQTAQSLYDLHRQWDIRHGQRPAATSAPAAARARDPARPLRIGYLSPDLRRHSVSCFLEPVLANHDRQAFTIYCYSNSLQADEVTARLRAHADNWRSVAGLADAAAARLIGDDEIDILVDLSGHTMANRLPLFSLKPAPVQVTWLGYPATTGLAAMDYRLTDALADPAGADDAWHAEKLLRLEGGFLCYQPPADAPEIGPAPGLKNGYVTFGSCNNLAKITAPTVAAWAQILDGVPTSKLLIKAKALEDAGVRDDLTARFTALGITADRLELLPWISGASPLSVYNAIDIALDTFPYTGTTTICETHWMGVPTLTLSGDRHAARVGHSLNARVGLEDWVSRSIDGYVARAVRAAAEPDLLTTLRRELRARMAEGPLCNGAAFTRRLEAAYREMVAGG